MKYTIMVKLENTLRDFAFWLHGHIYSILFGMLISGLVAIGVIAACSPAHAEVWGTMTTVSHHFQAPSGKQAAQLNDRNPGFGIAWAGKDFGVDAFQYRNSYGRATMGATGSWRAFTAAGVDAGVFAGVATGYAHPYIGGAYLQALVAKDTALRLIVVPKVGETRNAATSVTAQVRVRF